MTIFFWEIEKNKLPDGKPDVFLENLFLTVVETQGEVHTKACEQLAEQFHFWKVPLVGVEYDFLEFWVIDVRGRQRQDDFFLGKRDFCVWGRIDAYIFSKAHAVEHFSVLVNVDQIF